MTKGLLPTTIPDTIDRVENGPRTRVPGGSSYILAAGGLLEREGPDGVLIAVVHRSRYRDAEGAPGDYVLPKGKLEAGETFEETALREVEEETGCRGRIVGPSFPCEYRAGEQPKVVQFFRMTCVEQGPVKDTSEVREVLWLEPHDAIARLTYATERDVVRRAHAAPGGDRAHRRARGEREPVTGTKIDREVRQDVSDLLVRYATGIDRRDWELLRSCFADDCVADYGDIGRWNGADEITEWMRATHEPLGHTLHRITNQAVASSGDAVTARSYVDAIVLGPDNLRGAHAAGYYDDVVVRTDDGWKIARRKYTMVRVQAIGPG